jgi:hypothetical protein
MSHSIDDFDVDLVGTRYLLINLKHRDISDALRELIKLELSSFKTDS